MSDRERLNRIQTDLQKATTVIYLEGKTDPEFFFSLLGLHKPSSHIHQDAYVIGLTNGSSGSAEVAALTRVASENGLSGTLGAGGVFGIINGDGRDFAGLAPKFDAPFSGPVFSWKTYCIENMLAKATWPATWGAEPNWVNVLGQYTPYAALNRVHHRILKDLKTLGLHRFRNPQIGQPLEAATAISALLSQDKSLIAGRDVESEFNAEVSAIQAAIAASLDEGHTQINGKWFLRHYALTVTGHNEQQCRQDWALAVQAAGGLVEVRDWWQRITGSPP